MFAIIFISSTHLFDYKRCLHVLVHTKVIYYEHRRCQCRQDSQNKWARDERFCFSEPPQSNLLRQTFLTTGGCHRYLHRQSSESGRGKFGVNATRIYRTGVELLARPDQRLQVGDRIRVVGPSDAVERLAARLGNSHNQLDQPNILTIFVGIFIGILFGSLPIAMFLRIITAQVLILILG